MFIKVIPTAEVFKEMRGKGEKRREVECQLCDLQLPGERNPRDFKHVIESASDMLDPKKIYYLAGESFGVNRFGDPELKPYWNFQFIEESQVFEHFAQAARKPQKVA